MSTSLILARAARVYLNEQPSAAELGVLNARVTQGVVSLNQQILEISQSENREFSDADELARLFFILFDRAPDLPLFSLGMELMEHGGLSLEDLADVGLNFGVGKLSTTLQLSDREFMQRLAEQMFDEPSAVLGLGPVIDFYTAQLSSGSLTRGQMLAMAARLDSASTSYHNNVDTALFYLAGAGREASAAELAAATGTAPLPLLREILVSASQAPTLLFPFFSFDSNQLSVSGNFTEALQFNLSTLTSQLGTKSNFRVVYTQDNGTSEDSTEVSSATLLDIRHIDASAIASGLTSFSATASALGSELIAPNAPSTLTGGSGNDTLIGGSQADLLTTEAGNDSVFGGDGADTLISSQGANTLTGGLGDDIFVLPSSDLVRTVSNDTVITDFGNGVDVLNLAPLLGRTEEPSAVTPIVGNSNRSSAGFIDLTGLENNSVVLVTNTGDWVDVAATGDNSTDLLPRTPVQVAQLFTERYDSDADGVDDATRALTLTAEPTTPQTYVVFTYDPVNGADIWLIDNFTSILSVASTEVQLIGHLNPYADLWVTLTTSGSIIA